MTALSSHDHSSRARALLCPVTPLRGGPRRRPFRGDGDEHDHEGSRSRGSADGAGDRAVSRRRAGWTLSRLIRRGLGERQEHAGAEDSDAVASASRTLDDEVQAALVDRASRELVQVDAALELLRERRYGLCRECGAFIGLARLRSLALRAAVPSLPGAMPSGPRSRRSPALSRRAGRRRTRVTRA